jgi:hypothetical protein
MNISETWTVVDLEPIAEGCPGAEVLRPEGQSMRTGSP